MNAKATLCTKVVIMFRALIFTMFLGLVYFQRKNITFGELRTGEKGV